MVGTPVQPVNAVCFAVSCGEVLAKGKLGPNQQNKEQYPPQRHKEDNFSLLIPPQFSAKPKGVRYLRFRIFTLAMHPPVSWNNALRRSQRDRYEDFQDSSWRSEEATEGG